MFLVIKMQICIFLTKNKLMRKITVFLFVMLYLQSVGQELPRNALGFYEDIKAISHKICFKDLKHYDFSKIWLHNDGVRVGFIGKSYQKFDIHFDSIIKMDDKNYQVYGRTKVKDNICDFQGYFQITDIILYLNEEKQKLFEMAKEQGDKAAMNRFKTEKHVVIFQYRLSEDRSQYGSGLFKGIGVSYFEENERAVSYYDNRLSDSYKNNQFVGIWESYKTGAIKICHWGDYRISLSGDLDIGAGEFSPNPKYKDNGWEDYNPNRKDEWWK